MKHIQGANGKYNCHCCGCFTLDEAFGEDICDVCFWHDNVVQSDDPDYAGGANTMSLNEARAAYKKCGAKATDRLKYVRKPRPDELPS